MEAQGKNQASLSPGFAKGMAGEGHGAGGDHAAG